MNSFDSQNSAFLWTLKKDRIQSNFGLNYNQSSQSTALTSAVTPPIMMSNISITMETDLKPGETVLRTLFAQFAVIAEKKIDLVLSPESSEKPLSKSLQRGEDPVFDQLLQAFGSVAEHCLPSLLRTLFAWYERQISATESIAEQRSIKSSSSDSQSKATGKSVVNTDATEREELFYILDKRDLAVEFIFCLVLIEVLKQLSLHPGHEDLTNHIENLAFRHFRFREGAQNNPNIQNINMIADLYAEVMGVLAQSRFQSVRKRFMSEFKELRSKEPNPITTHSIISLLMGMKFFRIKMVPIEEFEASFQFMHECATYFLEVKDKDIKHALAGLFVEILVPVAATVKNEVNVPCLKNFVEMLYPPTLDLCTKKKHSLALFPLVTCLLCVSQKTFFLMNWHYFLAMCLSHLKNRDPKLCRVALESLYRLLWVYMIRIKCESNTATQSRLHSIVNSLFPKGSKAVVPRDTPLNIFVKIIQFIAQERLDFAMKEIVFDLLSVGRSIKIILTPERMSIGLRAFLVVADSLQQKDGEPPMPRTVGVLPSGNTLRVKKTYLNKMLTDEMARTIGMNHYYSYVRKTFSDILRALDVQFGRPLMMTTVQNINKEPDDMITGERKPKIDLFRTCVAAIPRLIPDGMSRQDLIDLLSRLTVHMDEEMKGLAFQSLQNIIVDFPDWREDVVEGFVHFFLREINDTFPQLMDNSLRMLLQILSGWRNAVQMTQNGRSNKEPLPELTTGKYEHISNVLHNVEALALIMLCYCRQPVRRLSAHILKETRILFKALLTPKEGEESVADVMDRVSSSVVELSFPYIPSNEKAAILSLSFNIDLQWLAERNGGSWISGQHDSDNNTNKLFGNAGTDAISDELKVNAWSVCLMAMMDEVVKYCSSSVALSWPLICHRLNTLFTHLDPTPPSDNRAAALLRGTTSTAKKTPTERDFYLELWKGYLMYACRIAPTMANNAVSVKFVPQETCASPDSLASERSVESRSPMNRSVSASSLFKQIIPLLRNEQNDLRNAVILGLSQVNHFALKELIEELVPYIREAIDRKQENLRRRKRREILRIQLGKLLHLISERNILGISPCVLDRDAGSLSNAFIEYIDGARLYLESETDSKDGTSPGHEIKINFCIFVSKLIKSFSIENRTNLLSRELRRNLFYLFASWSGKYCANNFNQKQLNAIAPCISESEYAALNAMSAVLCCGPIFDPQCLSEDSNLYAWIVNLLGSKESCLNDLGLETIVLLLEYNSDIGILLDWLVDCCYTKDVEIADGCFKALATIFSVRDYPCDHYIAIINVTIMNIGCPRASTHQLGLEILQILDYRFFSSSANDMMTLQNDENDKFDNNDIENEDIGLDEDFSDVQLRNKNIGKKMIHKSFEPILSGIFPCTQLDISKRMAQLHPHLTMPVFSEITYRFQTARPSVCQNLLQYLIPWLYNMELVDPHVQPLQNAFPSYTVTCDPNMDADTDFTNGGWGSVEATEMVLNNLFYITVKFGDDFPKEIEDVWCSLCSYWPNNLRIIMRYLFIITGLAPNELLPYSKRVVMFMARSKPERLIDEIMNELQTVESLNCLAERTEAPPFFRITSIRKGSGHSEDGVNGTNGNAEGCSNGSFTFEQGTLHTKRHSATDGINERYSNVENAYLSVNAKRVNENRTTIDRAFTLNNDNFHFSNENLLYRTEYDISQKPMTPQPRPLPMPEFGGYYAPLTEYLSNNSQPIVGFHRCNLALMLICDIVIDGVKIDWTPHIPLMLHVIFLGLDHTRPLVHVHCMKLLLNLLTVLTQHNDNLSIARIQLNNKTQQLDFGLTLHPCTPQPLPNFIDPPNSKNFVASSNGNSRQSSLGRSKTRSVFNSISPMPKESNNNNNKTDAAESTNQNVDENNDESNDTREVYSLELFIKCLIDFISAKNGLPLWNYEDITAKVWSIRSAEQLAYFLEHVLYVFKESLPNARIEERWAEVSLQLALSCSSRHYAGRSLQIFRALRIPINSRMLSDILSRLVETVAEQGEDMQGYVTELMLTLEAAVDSLDSDTRIIGELVRDFFKSTPNLSKDAANRKSAPPMASKMCGSTSNNLVCPLSSPKSVRHYTSSHIRSTSYSASYPIKKGADFGINEWRNRSGTDAEVKSGTFVGNCLGRSRSAQSLKTLDEQYLTPDDKTSLLAQFFWISVAMLETDYEHEFLLALRLLDKVLSKLSLEKNECQEKVEKIFNQMKWTQFPGVHAFLLKGCTSPVTYEPTMTLFNRLIPLLEIPVIDPSESANSFPHLVMAQLPYMLLNYDEPNNLCIQAAENFSHWCTEKSKKLDNLATVMMLYSRRSFSKENLQWTKCVVKYLYDAYSHSFFNLITFLVEVADKGPPVILPHVMSIIHFMLHYIDLSSTTAINNDILKLAVKYIESPQWKDALQILKLVVTRSSTLSVPPVISVPSYNTSGFSSILSNLQQSGTYSVDCISIASGASFSESEFSTKRELPGRTMEFYFDLTQTPIIGRKFIVKTSNTNETAPVSTANTITKIEKTSPVEDKEVIAASPRRSLSHNHSFNENSCNWRRPWLSQSRIRERLIGLLISCGQRVGLPKSPSVIFSQTSDIMDRQSSMASSTEEISATNNDASGDSKLEDGAHGEFTLFKEFDFLEYELESQEGESLDNFNWGVRRRSLSNLGDTPENELKIGSPVRTTGSLSSIRKDELSSDDEGGSVSPLYDVSSEMTLPSSSMFLPNALPLLDSNRHRPASMMSHSSSHSLGSEGDLTLSNTSASHSISPHVNQPHNMSNDIEDQWNSHLSLLMNDSLGTESSQTHQMLSRTFQETFKKVIRLTKESCTLLPSDKYRSVISHFSNLSDIFSSQMEFPFIHVDPKLFCTLPQLLVKHRLGVLEVQEHWETFIEKRDHAFECLDNLRSSIKLDALGEVIHNESSRYSIEDMRIDLCKCLYKIHFQLLLLIESYTKLVQTLESALNNSSVVNLSCEVTAIKRELMKSVEDTESDRQSNCSSPHSDAVVGAENNMRTESETHLRELIASQQWSKVIKHLHNMRQHFPGYSCLGSTEDDDINVILTLFCQQICESQNCYIIITEQEHNLQEITHLLMETSLQLSSTLHSLHI